MGGGVLEVPTRTQRSPRLRDVADRAGVSLGTASNVLNHPERVSPAAIERVRAAIDELGFVRNANASTLASGRSGALGLVVINLSNSMFVDVARGAQAAARAAGHNLLLADSADDFGAQGSNVDSFNEARVAGLLLAPMQDSSEHVARLKVRGIPVVLINYDQGDEDLCTVVVDNEQVGYLAVQHMLDIGCRRIAFAAGGDEQYQPVRLRRRGVRRAMREAAGAASFEEIMAGGVKEADGLAVAQQIAGRGPETRPDGIIGVSDSLASGLVEGLCDAGIAVPGDIAVMGCDRNSSAGDCRVPLTSITMKGQEMGTAAVRLLLDEMDRDGFHVHQRVVLTPELIVRGSTVRA
ncbi:LacI family DNA-binding transcriptional regulator [Actinomyces sp. MRS3W]|uniref:LacI family DNA-binding transcriptional regulator n=1 Tax=Actinomyces sp. MRS3W TaxID=2800796 RepID=UPI002353E584|nr:LacI family DNA-binding transcriptional regulator [Actinomyces sp. MRS3W]MDU0347833.1 LacI family DNA-binding transcriptional regulator [Actinomyces sp. MRS3W]